MVVDAPKEAGKLLSLAYTVVTTFLDFDDERNFKGCLIWIAESGIWSESHERVGERLANGLRSSAAAGASVGERPAVLLNGTGLVDAQSFSVLALLFGWDAFLIPTSGGYFVLVHHDSALYFVAQSFEILGDLRSRFQQWGPRDGVPPYFERDTEG